MSKFRKKPIVIEATQWFKNGDHPEDNVHPGDPAEGAPQKEGEVVRYHRTPQVYDSDVCNYCNQIMHVHGWVETLEGGHVVCPGDWVITGIQGERYPCKPDIFEATYKAV